MQNRKTKVLLVFYKMDRGGAETFAMNIYRAIDREKVSFDFIVHSKEKGKYDDEIKMLGGNIFYIPPYKITNHFSYVREWKKFFRENGKYDIVHAHATGPSSVFLPIAKKNGCVTIAHSHTSLDRSGIRAKMIKLYQIPLKWISDYLFACSEQAGEWMYGKRAKERDNYFVIKNAIDLEKFSFNNEYRTEIRNKYGLNEKFVVGYVARFHVLKNHSFLIDVFSELIKMEKDARLLLVGDGEERKNIEDEVERMGMSDKVIFTGVSSEVEKMLSAIDVIAMPSFNEGMPVSLVEAQASGVRILANDKISQEVMLTELIELYNIECGAKEWAVEVLKHKDKKRISHIQALKEKGYDNAQVAKWLLDFYTEKAEENK